MQVAHIAIRVNDIAASVAFYNKLGYQQAFAMNKGDVITQSFIKINDKQFIELYPINPQNPTQDKPEFLHLCFEGADLNAIHDYYVAEGLTPISVRTAGAGNLLFTMKGPQQFADPQNIEYTQYMPGSKHTVDFGQAAIRREGDDVTIIGISRMAVTAEKAAKVLSDEHEIEAEVIDPRTLRPLDLDTILASVHKTNRCVIVEEGWPHGGVGANLAALISEQAFDDLDAPVRRVSGADVPMPYSKPLEDIAYPHEPQILSAVLATLGLAPATATATATATTGAS